MSIDVALNLRFREDLAPLAGPAFAKEAFQIPAAFLEAVRFSRCCSSSNPLGSIAQKPLAWGS
jgi:hypothetical protein